MRKSPISLLVLLMACFSAFAQIPKQINKRDAAGKKQGTWIYYYDASWAEINNRDSAEFYRIENYKDDKPAGVTHDFYKNGITQWEGKILQDENPQILDSLITEFDSDGYVLRYDYFENGHINLEKLINQYNKQADYYKANPTINRQAYARLLNGLGVLYGSLGDIEQSEKVLTEALSIQKKVDANSMAYATIMDDLARILSETDNIPKSELLFKETLKIKEGLEGKNSLQYATTLNNLSNLYFYSGNVNKSVKLSEEVLSIYEKNGVTSGQFYGVVLGNLAVSYVQLKQYNRGEKIMLRSTKILEESLGQLEDATLNQQANLGRLYTFGGQYAKSEKILSQVVEASETSNVIVTPNDQTLRVNFLAQLYAAKGENEKAAEWFRKGYAKVHYKNAIFIEQHANFYFDRKLLSNADSLFAKATAVRLKQIQDNFSVMSEQQRDAYFTTFFKGYLDSYNSFAVSNALKRPSITGEMYDLQLATKAILLNSSAKWKQRIKTSGDVKLFGLYQEWEKMAKDLAKAESSGESPEAIAELRTKTEELEKTLTKRSDLFTKLVDKKKYTWKDVAAKLKPDEAAIEIIRFRKRGIPLFIVDTTDVKPKRYPKYDLTDTIYYAALIVKPGIKNPKLVLLKSGNDLEGKYLKFYQNNIRSQIEDKISYNQYWGEIAKELTGIKKVHLSSDGVYHRINVNSLMNPKTKKYVLDETEISLVTNTKDMLLPDAEAVENHYALLLGMPDFGSKKDFAELPGTKDEIEKVSTMLQAQGWQADTFLQENAKEENIKDAFKPAVLHIATHGYFKDEPTQNPLLQSGLVLAGAGNQLEASVSDALENKITEDGILTAYEAMNLNLDNTEIVVLSACETGLGEIKTGEGVYGLQRAFTVAGAKSIVMSLWKVNDETTREIMIQFYQKWMNGTSKADAFRQAQFELRKKYPAPYYWSAFVMVNKD